MYAIVKTGGKQYRVEKGQTLLVERLPEDEGAKVALKPLLYRSNEAVFDGADLGKVKVEAKILAHERGPKLRVFKFKPKRGYKRRTGHRQELTRIEVTDIRMGTRPAAAPKDEAAEEKPKAAAAETKPAAAETKPAAAEAKPAAPKAKPAAPKTKPAAPKAKPAAAKAEAKPSAADDKPKPARKPRAPKPADSDKES